MGLLATDVPALIISKSKTAALRNSALQTTVRYVRQRISQLHGANLGVVLIADPVEPSITSVGPAKLVLETRRAARLKCLADVQLAVAKKAVGSIPLSTLKGAVNARRALQEAVIASLSGDGSYNFCHSRIEADISLHALAISGSIDIVMSNDSDMLAHLLTAKDVPLVDSKLRGGQLLLSEPWRLCEKLCISTALVKPNA